MLWNLCVIRRPVLASQSIACVCKPALLWLPVWAQHSHCKGASSRCASLCCRVIDFGSIYASKTFKLKDGRRVLLGWAYETAAGCESECSTGTNFTNSLVSILLKPQGCTSGTQYFSLIWQVTTGRLVACTESRKLLHGSCLHKQHGEGKQGCYYFPPASLVPEDLSLLRQGWQGAHTLPREVQLDAESASLLMNPVEEVARLRQKQLYSNSSLQLPSNSSSGALKVTTLVAPLCLLLARAWPV